MESSFGHDLMLASAGPFDLRNGEGISQGDLTRGLHRVKFEPLFMCSITNPQWKGVLTSRLRLKKKKKKKKKKNYK